MFVDSLRQIQFPAPERYTEFSIFFFDQQKF
jgi:hypothetical protein